MVRRRYNPEQSRDAHGRWAASGSGAVRDTPKTAAKHVIVAKMGDYLTLRHDDLPGGIAYQMGALAQKWHEHLKSKYGATEDGMIAMDSHEVEAFSKGLEPSGTIKKTKRQTVVAQIRKAKQSPSKPAPEPQPAKEAAPHEALIARGAAMIPPEAHKQAAAYKKADAEFEHFQQHYDSDDDSPEALYDANQKYDRLREALVDSHTELLRTCTDLHDKLLKQSPCPDLKMSEYLNIDPQLRSAWGDETDDHKEAIDTFYQLVGGQGTNLLQGGIRLNKTGRAYASVITREVSIAASDSDSVLYHELAHHIEAASQLNPETAKIADATASFIRSRATGEPRPLSEITNNKEYGDDEMAYPGDFIHPYVGKIYEEVESRGKAYKNSEVLSVGMEHFDSPQHMATFFSKDPEHFQLILGIVQTLQEAGRQE